MSQILSRGHLQGIFWIVIAALSVYYSNVQGYHQAFPELSATVLRLHPDIIAFAETGEPLQMFLPAGYIVVARHDRTCHGGGILLLCRDHLFVNSFDCGQCHVSRTGPQK